MSSTSQNNANGLKRKQCQHVEAGKKIIKPNVDIDLWPRFVFNNEIKYVAEEPKEFPFEILINNGETFEVEGVILKSKNFPFQKIAVCQDVKEL